MVNEESLLGKETMGGEIEIERIPTRTIEARSKDLVPIFDYHRNRNFHQTRFVDPIKQLDYSKDIDIAFPIIALNDYLNSGWLESG